MRLSTIFLLSCVALAPLSCKSRSSSESAVRVAEQENEESLKKLDKLMAEYKAAPAHVKQAAKLKVWNFVKDLDGTPPGTGRLRSILGVLVARAPQTKDMNEADKAASADRVYGAIHSEIVNRERFLPWSELENQFKAAGAMTAASEGALTTDLARLGKTKWLSLDGKKDPYDLLLIDPKESWVDVRIPIIKNAKKSIWLSSWAFYDDESGNEAADTLIERHKAGVNVRVMLDGPVSSGAKYAPPVDRLIAEGIEVIRWSHPRLFNFGMHRKIMIVDHGTSDAKVIFGGRNLGIQYSSINVKSDRDRWRDTDMLLTGSAANQAARIFATSWNGYLDFRPQFGQGTNYKEQFSSRMLTPIKAIPAEVPAEEGREKIALVDHEPSNKEREPKYIDPIYLVTLKMIASAKREINISNAYFVLTTPIANALKLAISNGVKVNIHTNSSASLDPEDKPLLGPIFSSLIEILKAPPAPGKPAATVYLQQTSTLHSKYLVVDGKFGWIGSYNIHPRSNRYESETVGIFYGDKIGSAVNRMFKDDASSGKSEAVEADQLDKVTLPKSEIFELIFSFIFEQL